jgi:hypothetical protein
MPSILNNSSQPNTTTSIMNSFGNSLLSAGRRINRSGIGLSGGARQGIEGFISATKQGFNSLFAMATGPSLSVEGMQTQIKGLRASVPFSRLSPAMLEQLAKEIADAEAAAAETAVSPSSLGRTVDTEA